MGVAKRYLFKFRTNSNNSAIRGLVLNRTQSNAISIIGGATGVVVQGNYVGTDPTGLIARPNGLDNVTLRLLLTLVTHLNGHRYLNCRYASGWN